jgi:hypothetical protein
VAIRPRNGKHTPIAPTRPANALGVWYEGFSQMIDDEVHELLEYAMQEPAEAGRRWEFGPNGEPLHKN